MNHARDRFASLRQQARRGILLEGAAMVALALAGYGLLSFAFDRTFRLEFGFRVVLLGGFALLAARLWLLRVHRPLRVDCDDRELALAVERQDPALHQELISALDFESRVQGTDARGESRAMMQATVEHLERRLPSIPFHNAIDRRRTRRFGMLLAGIATAAAVVTLATPQGVQIWALRNLLLQPTEWPRVTQLAFLDVDPTRALRLAEHDDLGLRVEAVGVVPDALTLRVAFAGGEVSDVPMDRIGERQFTTTLEGMLEDATVQAFGGDGLSPELRIQLVPRPRLEELEVTLEYPAYLERGDQVLAADATDLEIPAGSSLVLSGRASKELHSVNLRMGEQDEDALVAEAEIDGSGFRGRIRPLRSGALRVELLDSDRLGAQRARVLQIRLAPDQAPGVEFLPVGIGTLLTRQARIPGQLRVRDDHGLTEVDASFTVRDAELEALPEETYQEASLSGMAGFRAGMVELEADVGFDLRPLSAEVDPRAAENVVRPGQLLGLRFRARDNRRSETSAGQETYADTIYFRVVTVEKMLEELGRRQAEQRRELERILEREESARDRLAEILAPGEEERAMQARQVVADLARQQLELGNRCSGVADSYGQILAEFANNRLLETGDLAPLRAGIVLPLRRLTERDFPGSVAATEAFAAAGSDDLRESCLRTYDEILDTIRSVLRQMEETESLAALIEQLRLIIQMEEQVRRGVEQLRTEASEGIFAPVQKTERKGGR